MGRKSKRSKTLQGNSRAVGSSGPKAASGVADDSLLRSPDLPDKRCRRTCSSHDGASTSQEPLPLVPESSSHTIEQRGRKKKDFDKLHPRSRFRVLKELSYPEWTTRCEHWWGLEIVITNVHQQLFFFEFNVYDLTALVLFNSMPLPSQYQPSGILSTDILLDGFHFYRSAKPCSGVVTPLAYLDEKSILVTPKHIKREKNGEEIILGVVRKIANHRVEYRALYCRGILTANPTTSNCDECRLLQKSIRDGTRFILSPPQGDEHEYAMRLTNLSLDNLTYCSEFLKHYFKEISVRQAKNHKWSTPILVFSLGLYVKLGVHGYEIIRKDLILPSSSCLKRITRNIDPSPGISHVAILAFLRREPAASLCISFDEIFYTSGFQIIRSHDGKFKLIGLTTYGSWDVPDRKTIRLFFNFEAETNISIEQPDEASTSVPSFNWCTEEEASAALDAGSNDERPSKMALHFVISSISSELSQAIGYIETFSMTAQILKCLLFRVISNIISISKHIKIADVPPEPTQNPGAIENSWLRFKTFSDSWSTVAIAQPSLRPSASTSAPWIQNFVPSRRNTSAAITAIAFDGSSHARSMVKSITIDLSGARYFVHPLQPNRRIFCISDIVHLIKRLRNNILKDRILIAPDIYQPFGLSLPHYIRTPDPYIGTFNPKLYSAIIQLDSSSIVSISPLNEAAIKLTPRTKMSFPLAKSLFHPRTILTFDLLEQQCMEVSDHAGAYLAYTAKGLATYVIQLLARTRGRAFLTGEHRLVASQQLWELAENFREWEQRNKSFHTFLQTTFPSRKFLFPNPRASSFGFFDANFCFDFQMTLVGLSHLCCSEEVICPRLLTSDCVESFFSTIRAAVGGGGQLNARSHRLSTRKAMLLRLQLFSYVGEAIERTQPLIEAILISNKPPPPALPDFVPENIPDLTMTRPLTNREYSVVTYISGWALFRLIREFPQRTWDNLIEALIGRLYKPVDQFTQMVSNFLQFCNELMKTNNLSVRPDAHSILIDLLIQHHTASFDAVLSSFSPHERLFLAKKISAVFLADRVRRDRKLYEKSFRNSL